MRKRNHARCYVCGFNRSPFCWFHIHIQDSYECTCSYLLECCKFVTAVISACLTTVWLGSLSETSVGLSEYVFSHFSVICDIMALHWLQAHSENSIQHLTKYHSAHPSFVNSLSVPKLCLCACTSAHAWGRWKGDCSVIYRAPSEREKQTCKLI